ncbi:hypothetical protein Cni_G08143 [Canna indica]|uniref:Uncharacterized protein n=1 Tax=Canna indica TaxID=4628 RepID=A0AAQ3K3J0_9LILI|nr:hypothetical protein Cni_G08143 [Canna indica]
MGKASKWLKNILTGKKEKDNDKDPTGTRLTPLSVSVPEEKRRWSFRRTSAAPGHGISVTEAGSRASAIANAAAVKIQTSFRSHLVRDLYLTFQFQKVQKLQ